MTFAGMSNRPTQQLRQGWRHEYAYTLGEQAFVYGFPYIYNAQLRHGWVTGDTSTEMAMNSAVNHFWHARTLSMPPTGRA